VNETESQYVDQLGDELGRLLYHTYQDIVRLRQLWRIYCAFFGANPERITLLNEASPVTTGAIQKALYDATLLGIRRLTDPKGGQRGTGNVVSISLFVASYKSFAITTGDDHTDKIERLKKLVSKARRDAEFARNWTNKRVAHSDWHVRIGKEETETVTRQKTTTAIESIAMVIKWVAHAAMKTTFSTIVVEQAEDEEWFLKHVFEGVEAMKNKEARYRELTELGKYTERDALYHYPDWLNREDVPRFDIID
jgi:AbiU2